MEIFLPLRKSFKWSPMSTGKPGAHLKIVTLSGGLPVAASPEIKRTIKLA